MQQQNKQKHIRNNHILNLRTNLKRIPILHRTTDRINNLIKNQQIKQNQQKSQNNPDNQTQIIDFNLQLNHSRTKSQDQHDFNLKFIIGQKIGQGTHGVVKKCYHKQTNKLYAVKIINYQTQAYRCLKRILLRLNNSIIQIQSNIKHFIYPPNNGKYSLLWTIYPTQIQVKLKSKQNKQLFIIILFIINYQQLRKIIYQIILGLQYIHQNNISHRDIKPQNILYDKQNNQCIIIDFGVSSQFIERGRKKQMLTLTGTPYYRAPEMFTGGGYDEEVDLWALGVLIYKLVTGVTPFQHEYHSDTINNILKGQVHFDQSIWGLYSHLVKNLVVRLLKPKHSRLTIKQAKKDFWFEKMKIQQDQDQLTTSSGFQWSLSLKRQNTDFKNGSFVRSRNPTISPQLTGIGCRSPLMFNLQNYEKQQKNMKWLNLQGNQEMDCIQSQEEQSTIGSSPTLKGRRKPILSKLSDEELLTQIRQN